MFLGDLETGFDVDLSFVVAARPIDRPSEFLCYVLDLVGVVVLGVHLEQLPSRVVCQVSESVLQFDPLVVGDWELFANVSHGSPKGILTGLKGTLFINNTCDTMEAFDDTSISTNR